MRPRIHLLATAALLALTVIACAGSDAPAAAPDDTDVAGVVIERAAEASSARATPRLPAGPAAVGITWSRADGTDGAEGAWVGLGARTLTAGEPPDRPVLEVTADRGAVPRPDGCEVLVEAPADAGLRVDGVLELRIVVDGPGGASTAIELEPVLLDVKLQPGEQHRTGMSGGPPLASAIARPTDAVSVRCEGRFEPR